MRTVHRLVLLPLVSALVFAAGCATRVRAHDEELRAIVTSFDSSAYVPPGAAVLSTTQVAAIQAMFERLAGTGYSGDVILEGHAGDFMWVGQGDTRRLAAGVDDCASTGCATTTSQYNLALGDRMLGSLDELLEKRSADWPFRVRRVSYGKERPTVRYPLHAGDPAAWNDAALRDNRITMRLCERRRCRS